MQLVAVVERQCQQQIKMEALVVEGLLGMDKSVGQACLDRVITAAMDPLRGGLTPTLAVEVEQVVLEEMEMA